MSNIRVDERKKIDIDRSDLFILSHLSRDMIISTMWYLRPAKPQISLRIIAG